MSAKSTPAPPVSQEDGTYWLAMLLRRIAIMIVVEVERRFDMEPSLRTRRERERRAHDPAA